MLLLVNAEEERLMAYQQAKRSSFTTRAGVDKRFGAETLARHLDLDLAQSIGAGDTPVDVFLSAMGLAVQVGRRDLEHKGLRATAKVPDSLGLGALFVDAAAILESR